MIILRIQDINLTNVKPKGNVIGLIQNPLGRKHDYVALLPDLKSPSIMQKSELKYCKSKKLFF